MVIYNVIEDNDGDIRVHNFAAREAAEAKFKELFTEKVDNGLIMVDEIGWSLEKCLEKGSAYFDYNISLYYANGGLED